MSGEELELPGLLEELNVELVLQREKTPLSAVAHIIRNDQVNHS